MRTVDCIISDNAGFRACQVDSLVAIRDCAIRHGNLYPVLYENADVTIGNGVAFRDAMHDVREMKPHLIDSTWVR
jgi:hypothetical protein